MDPQLLTTIIMASAANRSDNSPHGYCFRPPNEAGAIDALKAGGMLEVGADSPQGIPVRPTDLAVKTHAEWQAQAHHTPAANVQQLPAVSHGGTASPVITLDNDVPMPEAKAFGAQRSGPPLVEQFGFANMQIGQSFFIPQSQSSDPDKKVHQTFSSVVSQANKKLHPMNFAIREVDETAAGRGKGARIWRIADYVGERPTRTRAKRTEQPAPAPQGQAGTHVGTGFGGSPGWNETVQGAPGFAPQPQGGFPAGGGFPGAAPGFAAPGAAGGGFGPGPAFGTGDGGPSFG